MIHKLRQLETNPHTCKWDENIYQYNCTECNEKSDIYSEISDFYKDRWGVRPRFSWQEYTLESLQSALDYVLEHCYMCAGYRRCYEDCTKNNDKLTSWTDRSLYED